MVKKTDFASSILFIIVGILCTSSLLINYISERDSKNWIEEYAYVTDCKIIEAGHYSKTQGYKVSNKYEIEIRYFVNELDYKTSVITSVKENQRLLIKYNPIDPSEIKVLMNANKGFPLIILIIGFIFIFCGLVLLIRSIFYKLKSFKSK